MEKIRYEEMLPHEIVARRERFPAAFIGLGGLEWHGEHLAVGNDGREDESLIGVGGIDPRQEASIEVGRKACDLIVEGMVRKAKELIARTERGSS